MKLPLILLLCLPLYLIGASTLPQSEIDRIYERNARTAEISMKSGSGKHKYVIQCKMYCSAANRIQISAASYLVTGNPEADKTLNRPEILPYVVIDALDESFEEIVHNIDQALTILRKAMAAKIEFGASREVAKLLSNDTRAIASKTIKGERENWFAITVNPPDAIRVGGVTLTEPAIVEFLKFCRQMKSMREKAMADLASANSRQKKLDSL